MANILIVGCGAIGYPLADRLAKAGHRVIGLKRTPALIQPENFKIISADISVANDVEELDGQFDVIFFIVSANRHDETSYQTLYETGLNNLINRFQNINIHPTWFFISSTSVYGQNQGEWVDETSSTEGSSTTSRYIIAAEKKLMTLQATTVIVRFSGIYGPGREYLLRMAQQTPTIQHTPAYFTNRIHQEDCLGILVFLLQQHLTGVALEPCYLASDDDPAPLWDVITWLATKLHCPLPIATISEMDNNMNKRCQNNRLKQLGYVFKYPNYKTGYGEIINTYQIMQNATQAE